MPATLIDKLLLPANVALILGKTLSAAVTGVFTGTYGADTYGEYLMHTAVRGFLGDLSINQIQWLVPNSISGFKSWSAKNNLTPEFIKIPCVAGDATGFWIGNKSTAKYHMVYYHGGGFIMPANTNQYDLVNKWVRWSNNTLAAFVVDYTLSPEAPYPIALSQCVEGLRYVLNEKECDPSRVLIGGDSAGGNLALTVLGHLTHPHPSSNLVKPLPLSQPILGTVMISPWISPDVDRYASFKKNQYSDSFPPHCATRWSKAYDSTNSINTDKGQMWAARADASWWTNTPCKSMLATVGGKEIAVDSVVDWAQKYKQAKGEKSLELVVATKEVHIQPILEPAKEEVLEKATEVMSEVALMKWIKQVCV